MKKNKTLSIYICLIVAVIILLVLNICVGSVKVPLQDAFLSLAGKNKDTSFYDIVMLIRFPRAVGAIVLGGGLSLAGYALQSFFHNPIAGPYLLGISSGAKLTVALLFVFAANMLPGTAYGAKIICAFLGAFLAMGFVLLCSRKINNMAMLLVCGIMIGYICSAVTDFVVTFAKEADIVNLHNWTKGSLSGLTWMDVLVLSVIIIISSLALLSLSKPLSAYAMGESYARSVGVNIKRFRVCLVVISSLLAATVTAFAGPVSFVGIAVPHIVRGLIKSTKPIILIPACFIGGGAFCLLCDFVARILLSPVELSISTVTAFFGAPVVIYILIQRRKKS